MIPVDRITPNQGDVAAERDAQRYVSGRMTEEEEQRFEVAMLEHPEIAAHVKLTRQMRAGLQQLEERGELSHQSAGRPSAKSWGTLVAAAVVVLAVGGGLLSYLRQSEESHGAVAGSPARLGLVNSAIAGSYMLAHTRGRPDVPSLRVSGESGPLEIRILPDQPDPSGNYQVALQRQVDTQVIPVGTAKGLAASANGWVPVYVNPTALVTGEYTLILKGRATPEEKYRLRIERSE